MNSELFSGMWRVGITAVFLMAGYFYVCGWLVLHRQNSTNTATFAPASPLSLAAFCTGLLFLFIVFISPLYQLATRYFYARVTQDLLLVAWIPGLLLSANPAPVLWAGFSPSQQHTLARFAQRYPIVERSLGYVNAGAAWIAFVSCFWFWYDVPMHQITIAQAWIRPFQILSMLTTSLFYWWHITGATPYPHTPLPRPVRIFYAITAAWAIKAVGLLLVFSPTSPYDYPAASQIAALGFSDHSIGSIVMWMLGGIAFSTTATLLMRGWLGEEENKPTLPVSVWSSDEALIAPGFAKQR